ncbi:MAG: TonB-dependent receptor [Pseudomonadota bacterium]
MRSLLLPLLLLSGAAHALEDAVSRADESLYLQELPIVLTPSRLPQPLDEAPAAVTVIDRELIRATGYRDLPRLFRLVPGMQIGQERASTHWVTYHGLGNDLPSQMQVLVDGRSVYSPGIFGGVDWTGLPVALDEIERIEIVRGTDSVGYGANAFLGVINIITRHTADARGPRAKAGAGTHGVRLLELEAGGGDAATGLRLNASVNQDDGFAGLNDGQAFQGLSLRADRQLGLRDELTLRVAARTGQRGAGYADSTYGNNAERDWDSGNAAVHLQWRHTPGPDEEWLLHYYHNQDDARDEWLASAWRADVGRMAYVPLNRNRDSARDNLELQHRSAPSADTQLVWGMEARHDQVDSPFLYAGDAHQETTLGRLFGHLEWRHRPDLVFNLGALAEKYDGDPVRLSPRAFANWHASPTDTFRLGYARAWLQPTLFERYGDVRAFDPADGALLVWPYLPNPELRPPRIDSVEIGYLGRLDAWRTRVDLRVFVERIHDHIWRVSHPEVTAPLYAGILPSARYENLSTPVTQQGFEYQLESRPAPGTRLLFSHTVIDNRCSDAFVSKLTAPYSASLSWLQDWGSGWSSTLTALRMGPVAGGDGYVPRYQYVSPPYTTFDLRLARQTRIGGTPAEVALMGTNLGGRHQEIADRSEQYLHGLDPANRTSPTLWLTLSLNPQ